MNENALLASYKQSMHRISIYSDRVELRVLTTKTYPLWQIESATFKTGFFYTTLRLALTSGVKTEPVAMPKVDAPNAQHLLTQLLQRYAAAIGIEGDARYIGCTVVGGSGSKFLAADPATAVFDSTSVQIIGSGKRIRIPYGLVTSLSLDGPGRVTTNAGIVGGGFGIEGAAVGMGAASLLNALTQKSTVNTFMRIAWASGELFVHTSRYTPEEARVALSHAFTALQRPAQPVQSDIASLLERLDALKRAGTLNESEFELAKARALQAGG